VYEFFLEEDTIEVDGKTITVLGIFLIDYAGGIASELRFAVEQKFAQAGPKVLLPHDPLSAALEIFN